jgi:hypothetical protein
MNTSPIQCGGADDKINDVTLSEGNQEEPWPWILGNGGVPMNGLE